MNEAPRIAVIDLETTGLAPPEHMPIEIGRCDLIAKKDLFGAPDWQNSMVMDRPAAMLIYPGRLVPPESSAIHHLITADLINEPMWADATSYLKLGPHCSALAAHSARFEMQWLTPDLTMEIPWICTWKCALRAWPDAPAHSNQALRYWLAPAGLDRIVATPAHRAGPDAYVTAFLLRELLHDHAIETLIQWTNEPAVLIRVPFGKPPEEGGNRGMKWTEVEDGLLHWTVNRGFSDDILHTVKLEIRRREKLPAMEFLNCV